MLIYLSNESSKMEYNLTGSSLQLNLLGLLTQPLRRPQKIQLDPLGCYHVLVQVGLQIYCHEPALDSLLFYYHEPALEYLLVNFHEPVKRKLKKLIFYNGHVYRCFYFHPQHNFMVWLIRIPFFSLHLAKGVTVSHNKSYDSAESV